MFKTLMIGLIGLLSLAAHAQEPQVLTFQGWKEQQILDAQNQVLRISARITHLKTSKAAPTGNKETVAPLANAKIKKTEADSLILAERDLRRAQESLKGAAESTLEEYVNVYLPTLRGSPEAAQALAQKLSKEELAEIFKVLLRKDNTPDTKRNSPSLAEGLSISSRTSAP